MELMIRLYGNLSKEDVYNLSIPYRKDGKRSGCLLNLLSERTPMINESLQNWNEEVSHAVSSSSNYTYDENVTYSASHPWIDRTRYLVEPQPCTNGRMYSQKIYGSTIVSEFDLACENAWQLSTCTSIFFSGKLLGVLVSGFLSDRFGRRPVFLGSVIVLAVSGIALAFSPNMTVFCVLFVIQGTSDSCMEFVGPSKRKIAGTVMGMCYGLGHTLLAVEAYFFSNWRHLALVAGSPGVVIILFWFFLPESARWLLSRGKHKEAKAIIAKVAAVNKVTIEEDTLERLFKEENEEKTTRTHSPLDLFRTWKRARLALLHAFISAVTGICYYGLALNAQGLGGSIYINFALLGAADIPAQLVSMLFLDKIGRRKLLLLSLCGDFEWAVIAMAVMGKMVIGACKDVLNIVAVEMYPTVIRNIGVTFSNSFCRAGGLVAPQILFLAHLYRPLPFITWGTLSLLGGILAMLLPDTLGKPLPQTLEAWDARLNCDK
ncbi:organic cation transporter protein-like [Lingula anatina]|uniref:Organic cation transporter protein-like n=1 Tax=Lingula anatina TaxID=7574 RepID=A0A1S3JMH1_LINAN|nr:organic cation transporter protein-like [Lingula anatina]|eukprot:XP_013411583.1 organic cation transporter protein-like [Lingula anatina]